MSAVVIDLEQYRASKRPVQKWMGKRELAEHLGYSPRWVQYRVAEGMPHRRHYGRLAFLVTDVERWLALREEAS